jgi:hypothetical protein
MLDRRRRILIMVGLLALALAAWLATSRPVVNGVACGPVLYDTHSAGACAPKVDQLTAASVAIGFISMVLMVAAAAPLSPKRRGVARAGMLLLIGAGMLGVVVANRLLEPANGRYCGSVVNRHHYVEPLLNLQCDNLLRPHRNQAVAAGAGAVLAAGVGLFAVRDSGKRRYHGRTAGVPAAQHT